MSAAIRLLGALTGALVVAGAAHASGGGEGNGLADLGWYTLNFALLVAVLVYLARTPIRSFFSDRRALIQEQLRRAADALTAAEKRHAELQRQLVDLDRDLQEIRVRSRERAQAECNRMLAEAAAAARRIEEDARAAVEREVERARMQLRLEASELAIEIAATRLQSGIDDRDRERLLEEFIHHVEAANGAGTGASR